MGGGLADHAGPAEAGGQLRMALIVDFREALWRLESGGNRRIRSNDGSRAARRFRVPVDDLAVVHLDAGCVVVG